MFSPCTILLEHLIFGSGPKLAYPIFLCCPNFEETINILQAKFTRLSGVLIYILGYKRCLDTASRHIIISQ